MALGNDRTLRNALLLLILAIMTSLGGGVIALLSFLPCVLLLESGARLLARMRESESLPGRTGHTRGSVLEGNSQ